MSLETKTALIGLLCGCTVALSSCTYSRPPQTSFYCVDIPDGMSADVSQFAQSIANRLSFKVSAAQFPSTIGPSNQVWEVYGGGVSLFIGTAMKDGNADGFGNIETTFDPNRLSLQVAKTAPWQRVHFDAVLTAAESTAHQMGWSFAKAPAGRGCAT